MARKIKFALEMKDGAKVRSNLEELRENFDLEKAVGYFLSGKLVEWLEDRYYEDEAEKLEAIDKDAPDLRARLCEALGVECEEDAALDVEALERLNEKKAVLRQKTSDETIIANADKTALTQEDLADLLDMDEPVIYLCGDSFNVPARVKNKKYVGVLGTPTISIKANSQEDLNTKGIVFENVKLPWGQTEEKKEDTRACAKCGAKNPATAKFCNGCGAAMDETTASASVPPSSKDNTASMEDNSSDLSVEELVELYDSAASKRYDDYEHGASVWEAVQRPAQKTGYEAIISSGFDEIFDGERTLEDWNFGDGKKKMVLRVICKNKHKEDEVVHCCINEDMSAGFVASTDGIYLYDKYGFEKDGNITEAGVFIPYKNVQNANSPFAIGLKDNSALTLSSKYDKNSVLGCWQLQDELATYLNAVKDIA